MESTLTSLRLVVHPGIPFSAAVLLPVPLSTLSGLPLPARVAVPASLCCDVTVASFLADCSVTVSSKDISA